MDYLKRVDKLRHSLKQGPHDALLIDNTTNIFYLTGLQLSMGKILVFQKGAALFVDNRYFEHCSKHSCIPVFLVDAKTFEHHMQEAPFTDIHTLNFDSETTSYKSFLHLQKMAEKRGNLKVAPTDAPLKLLRAIKDDNEITLLKAAANLNHAGMNYAQSLLKEGITEIELATELEIFWKKRGSRSISFDPIIAFGANSSMPHYRAGNTKLKKGDIVLLDIGTQLDHYHSDMTRTVFFGEPHPQLKEIHQIVAEAQRAAIKLCHPGTTLGQLDKAARDLIASRGYGPNFTHNLGHGVGLEIHEYPSIKNAAPFDSVVLEKNMVITIEPGIYIPDLGGVRIEDTVVITDSKECLCL